MSDATTQAPPRYRTDAPVELFLPDGSSLAARAEDISHGGLFVRTNPALLAPGARVRLALHAPAPEVQLEARVVHVMDEGAAFRKNRAVGVGLQFDVMPQAASVGLQGFLYRLFRQGRRIHSPRPPPRDGARVGVALAEAGELLAEVTARPRGISTGVLEQRVSTLEEALLLVPDEASVATSEGPASLLEVVTRVRAHLALRRAEDRAAPGNSDAASSAFESSQRWPHVAIQLRAVDVLFRCGDYSAAATVMKQLAAAQPQNQTAWRVLLTALEKMADWPAAERAALKLMALCPAEPSLVARLDAIHAQMAGGAHPEPELPPVAPGSVLGRYRVLERLGQGGMAQVWLARQDGPQGFSKHLVIKTIAPQSSQDPLFMQLFLDEARLAAQLNHPNIVQLFELGEHQGVPFLVMEHLDGRTLAQVLDAAHAKGLAVPPCVSARIMADACAALAFAHALPGPDGKPLGVIHRDVSPDNILVTYQGQVKLLDFGIARATQHLHATNPGTIRGKLAFLAPEQVRVEPLDRRVDVWAVGVNLYLLLMGGLPFSGENEMATMLAIAQDPPRPPAHRGSHISADLDAVVKRALQKAPDARFQDAAELQRALEAFLVSQPVGAPQLAGFMEALFPASTDARRQHLAQWVGPPVTPNVAPLPLPPVVKSGASTEPPAAPAAPARPSTADPNATWLPAWVPPVVAAMVGMAALVWVFLRPAPPPPTAAPAAALEQVAPRPPAPPLRGGIGVECSVPADLFVDGTPAGRTPATVQDLPPGEHAVKVVSLEGQGSRTFALTVVDGELTRNTVKMEQGTLELVVSPWANVKVDGQGLGRTPLGPVTLWEGPHVLTLRHPGQRGEKRVAFDIAPGAATPLRIRMDDRH